MSLIDWLIVVIPFFAIAYIGFRTQRYTKDVSDFLTAGRVAGRYVLSVSTGMAGLGLITVVGMFEMYYNSGFGIGFWNSVGTPIALIVLLTGFVVYRFRETRAMTISQFFEMRYSRKFRFFTGILQAVAGIVNYGLFPAVGARFLVYYTDLPMFVDLAGFTVSTYAIVMALFLGLAGFVVTRGGQTTIMVTDCVQGVLSYPMYLIVVVAIMCTFSWWDHFTPVLLERPTGQSFLNPFDTHQLRDFNLFYIFVGIFGNIYNLISWSGMQGYNAAGISPHEQKMARVLGAWRAGFSGLMYVLLAMAALAYMNHAAFKDRAIKTEQNLAWKTLEDVAPSGEYSDVSVSEEVISARKAALPAKQSQVFRTISNQMRVPVALRDILPVGATGIFCAIMMFLMISTDTASLHSWGSIIIQDVVLPIQKKAFEPKRHLFYLRLAIIGVALYAFIFSLFFGQVTYILMFFALTGSVWLGGAGAVIIGGLYWKRGTTAGAWTSLIIGSILSVLGIVITQYWVSWIYPILSRNPQHLNSFSELIKNISHTFEPIILWRVTPERFFLNGQEIFFITMLFSILSYIVVSLLTCKEPFNMDRMLHRGQYRRIDDTSAALLQEKK